MTSYRPDIDGLRALAILCVVLYHAKVPGFDGGYVGVDIFFAISGFLIFSLLQEERTRAGAIDWRSFFARRIRRLLPEATVVIVVVTILGFWMLRPIGEQQGLAKSGIAGSLWVGNFYFWLTDNNYFSPWSERQPLLHLWSLGVEEQFYAATPLLFIVAGLAARGFRVSTDRALALILAALGILSLCFATAMARHAPDAGYFLLPARAYEFLLGAIFGIYRHHTIANVRIVRALWFAGAVGIVLSVLMTSPDRPFPGYWALLPATSATLLLWLGANPAVARLSGLLSVQPLVYIGQVSYGWYLWHFPALVLWREYWLFETTTIGEIGIAILALAPAGLGFHIVSAIRRAAVPANARPSLVIVRPFTFAAVAATFAVLASASLGAHAKYVGAPALSPAPADNLRYGRGGECDDTTTANLPRCHFGDITSDVRIVVWGDSHSRHWIPALDPLFKELGVRGIERSKAGCPPALSESRLYTIKHFKHCEDFAQKVIAELARFRDEGPVAVILSARWAAYANKRPLSAMDTRLFPTGFSPGRTIVSEALETTLRHLDSIRVPAGLLQQVPEQELDVPRCLPKRAPVDCETLGTVQNDYLADARELLREASAVTARSVVFDPALHMCRSGRCKVTVGHVRLYHDDNHLSTEGAQALVPLIANFTTQLTSLALQTSPTQAIHPPGQSARPTGSH